MPKYTIDYAFDCTCYGSMEIDAKSPKDAAVKARQLFERDELFDGWDPQPDCGTENHRVVDILDKNMDFAADRFDLDQPQELGLTASGILDAIDAPLFKRQRMALIQAIDDSPHPLRTELLTGLNNLLDEIADCMERQTGVTDQFIEFTDSL